MSRKLRFIVAGAGLVVIIILAWMLLLSPIRGQIATTEASVETQRTALASAQAKLAQAQAMKEEGKKNQARLLELAKMMPSSDELPSLLLQIQDLADQAGIQFSSVTPGEAMGAQGFQILPLNLSFTGSFFDLTDFAYRAEQLAGAPGRLLAIKTLGLSLSGEMGTSGKKSSPQLSVSMLLYAFESADTTAAAAAGASGASTAAKTTANGS